MKTKLILRLPDGTRYQSDAPRCDVLKVTDTVHADGVGTCGVVQVDITQDRKGLKQRAVLVPVDSKPWLKVEGFLENFGWEKVEK